MKYIILIVSLCCISAISYGQKADGKDSVKKVYWGIKGGVGLITLESDLAQSVSSADLAMSGGFFIEYRPLRFLGFETGASYMSFKSTIEMPTAVSTFKTRDDEGDAVEHRFQASDLSESQEIALLNIPLAIKLNAYAGNWEFFAKGGMVYSSALSATYSQEGMFTNHGYYTDYNVLIDDLPQHGYYTDKKAIESGDVNWKSAMQPFVGAGIVLPGKKSTRFFIEAQYLLGGASTESTTPAFNGRMNNEAFENQILGSVLEAGESNLSGLTMVVGLRF